MGKVINFFCGRNTLMAIFFTIMGTILQWVGKLDMNYIMLIGVIQALVLGHSVKEDIFNSKITVNPKVAAVATAVLNKIEDKTATEGEGDVK